MDRLTVNRSIFDQFEERLAHFSLCESRNVGGCIDDVDAPSDIPGLTEGEVCEALLELIEDGAIYGEPVHGMGRREPLQFNRLYPTLYGLQEIEDLASLTAQAMPLLRAQFSCATGSRCQGRRSR